MRQQITVSVSASALVKDGAQALIETYLMQA
jgi:hypothetical protein